MATPRNIYSVKCRRRRRTGEAQASPSKSEGTATDLRGASRAKQVSPSKMHPTATGRLKNITPQEIKGREKYGTVQQYQHKTGQWRN